MMDRNQQTSTSITVYLYSTKELQWAFLVDIVEKGGEIAEQASTLLAAKKRACSIKCPAPMQHEGRIRQAKSQQARCPKG
jgi:hypothetical protein